MLHLGDARALVVDARVGEGLREEALVVLLLDHGGDHGAPGREHLDGGGAPGARGGLEARELARGPLVEGPSTQLRFELVHKAGHRRPADEAVDHGRQHDAARAEERGVGDADAEAQPAATVADRHAEPLPRKIVGQDQRPGLAEGVARRARDGRVEVREEAPGRRHVHGLRPVVGARAQTREHE